MPAVHAERSSVRGRSAGEPLAGHTVRRGESVPHRTVAPKGASPSAHPVGKQPERIDPLIARVRANRYLVASLAAGAGALLGPALAWAGSGGAGAGPGSSTSPPVTPANIPVTASSGGVTIQTEASAFLHGGVSVTGSAPAGDAGDTVEIDQLAPGSTWTKAALATVQAGGSFTVAWHPSQTGQFTIRAVLQGAQASQAASAPPAVSVTVYRRSLATLYGPGFYGQRTACGEVLRRHTIGVANRTLACGTEVSIYYAGHAITVPVIDRGPYAHNANWDITMATARALGMQGTETIGAAATSSPAAGSPSAPATGSASVPAGQ